MTTKSFGEYVPGPVRVKPGPFFIGMEHWTRCQNVWICLAFLVLLLAVQNAAVSLCDTNNSECSTNAACTETDGMVGCTCNAGFIGDGFMCDVLETTVAFTTDTDVTTGGSTGFPTTTGIFVTTGDGDVTTDVTTVVSTRDMTTPQSNACDQDPCDNSGGVISCEEVGGNDFTCFCQIGYDLQGTTGPCMDINECETNNVVCSSQTTCVNNDGSFQCNCKEGFTGNGLECIDDDECDTNTDNCSSDATCDNTAGSFTCTCNDGYTGNGVTCSDINECDTNNGNCSSDATCANMVGSFTCTCNDGFTGNGFTCTDINECDTNNGGCSSDATCANMVGSFTCTCNDGFTGNGVTCTDINECDTNNGGCSSDATCANMVGSFTCTCNDGFTGNGVTCTDINECNTNNGGCSSDAMCANMAGSFTCTCNAGFTGNGVTCTELSLCDTENGGCSTNAACTETGGEADCTCNAGYTGDGIECNDINECNTNNGGCSSNAACVNTGGSFTYINECDTNNGGCSSDATCANMEGSFTCTCNTGFTGNGVTCNDNNECETNNGGCSSEAACGNTDGSFTCTCNTGYTGNGVTCNDINECTTANPCDQICSNTAGSFTCSCNDGFVEDPQNPNSCIVEGMCCPVSTNAVVNDRLLTTSSGICIFYDPNLFEMFDNANSECVSRTLNANLPGGQLYTEPGASIDPTIRNFVDDLTPLPINIFPTSYVNFRRTSSSNPFLWGDETELQSNDGRWVDGAPSNAGTDLNCGALIDDPDFGFTNVRCDVARNAICTVNGVTCPAQGLSSRILIEIESINNEEAVFYPALDDPESSQFIELNETVCNVVIRNVHGNVTCNVTALEEGSIVAYVEVNMTRTHTIRTSEQLKGILLSRQRDENGYIMLHDTNGNVLSIDPGGLEVDDREDLVCKSDSCNNGGTCTFDSRFIQSACQCQSGFQGAKCERTDDSSLDLILLVVLALALFLLMVVSSFVCIIYLRKKKSLSAKKGVYSAEWPETISNHVPMQTLYKGVDSQLVMRNAFAQLDEEFQKRNSLPRVIRNRRVDVEGADSTSITSGSDLGDNEEDDYDIETILDRKRMSHFEQVFYRATERYPRAASLHDTSSMISSGTSIIKPPLSDAGISEQNREFETPYPADGTVNN